MTDQKPPSAEESAKSLRHESVISAEQVDRIATALESVAALEKRCVELQALVRQYGACGKCGGDGEESEVVDDGLEIPYERTLACDACDGTGLEADARAVLGLDKEGGGR